MSGDQLRRARVIGHDSVEQLARYLPFNYEVVVGPDGQPYIEGHDYAGWTLDDYVIPRLASGLIVAEEVSTEGVTHGSSE